MHSRMIKFLDEHKQREEPLMPFANQSPLFVFVNQDSDAFQQACIYTDLSSLAPTKYKINLISVLVFCAFHICLSYRNFHEEIVRIKKILTDIAILLP